MTRLARSQEGGLVLPDGQTGTLVANEDAFAREILGLGIISQEATGASMGFGDAGGRTESQSQSQPAVLALDVKPANEPAGDAATAAAAATAPPVMATGPPVITAPPPMLVGEDELKGPPAAPMPGASFFDIYMKAALLPRGPPAFLEKAYGGGTPLGRSEFEKMQDMYRQRYNLPPLRRHSRSRSPRSRKSSRRSRSRSRTRDRSRSRDRDRSKRSRRDRSRDRSSKRDKDRKSADHTSSRHRDKDSKDRDRDRSRRKDDDRSTRKRSEKSRGGDDGRKKERARSVSASEDRKPTSNRDEERLAKLNQYYYICIDSLVFFLGADNRDLGGRFSGWLERKERRAKQCGIPLQLVDYYIFNRKLFSFRNIKYF